MSLQTFAVNTSLVLIAKILNSIFSLTTFLLIARALPLTEVGAYVFLLSVAAVLGVLSNCGTNELLFRRSSSAQNKIPKMLRAASISRLTLGIIFGAIAATALLLTHPDFYYHAAIPLAFLVAIIDAQTIAYIMTFRAQGNMLFEAKLYIGRGAAKLALVAIAIHFSPHLVTVLMALVATNIGGVLFARYINRRDYAALACRVSKRYIFSFVKLASPYLLMSIFATLDAQADIIMLGLLKGSQGVGLYSVASQIYTALLFVPVSLNIALQPVLVKHYNKNIEIWHAMIKKIFIYLLMPAVIFAILLATITPYLLHYLFASKYDASIEATTILIYAFCFQTLWVSAIHTALISANKLRLLNKLILFGLSLHIFLNLILIKPFGANGAAYSTLATVVTLVTIGSTFIFRKKAKSFFS